MVCCFKRASTGAQWQDTVSLAITDLHTTTRLIEVLQTMLLLLLLLGSPFRWCVSCCQMPRSA
jgi:hypothetical protein